MALNINEDLDLSKENIQPLRQGETQQLLHRQREQFLYMIRMYEGDDILEPYYKYVIWSERSFPKMGRESNLIPLLEGTVLKFKTFTKYKQDPRLIQLLIKYINVQPHPLKLYQLYHSQGLGTLCSMFYKAWAKELDKNNDFKKADQVFQLGINYQAQPLKELQDAHIQFQLSIARRMLEGNMNQVTNFDEPSRAAFFKLPSSKIPVNGTNKNNASVFHSISNKIVPENYNVGPSKFHVYEEDEVDGCMKYEFKTKHDKLPKGSVADRENVMKTEKWCGLKQKQRADCRASDVPVTSSFQIHEDPEAACEQMKSVLRSRAVKLRKEELNCPVAVFEPVDPTKKPMYPKHLVYDGGRDIQLEEIRAAYYQKNQKLASEYEIAKQNAAMDVFEKPVNLTESCSTSVEQKSDSLASVATDDVLPPEQDFSSHVNTFTIRRSSKMSLCTTNVSQYDRSKFPTNFVMPTTVAAAERTISEKTEYISNKNQFFNENYGSENIAELRPSISRNTDVDMKESSALDVKKSSKGCKENYVGECSTNHECSNKNVAVTDQQKLKNALKLHQIEDDILDFRSFNRDNNVSAFLHHSPSTSMTINTRTAMKVIQKMWESPLAPQNQKHEKCLHSFADAKFKMSQARSLHNFGLQCFEDEDINAANNFKPPIPFNVFSDDGDTSFREVKKPCIGLPFAIYGDENAEVGRGTRISSAKDGGYINLKSDKCSFPGYSEKPSDSVNELLDVPFTQPRIIYRCTVNDEEELAKPMGSLKMSENENNGPGTPLPFIVPVNLQDTPLEPEDKENRPPKDYSTPSERRPLCGVLTPATNVPVKEIDSEASDDEHDSENCLIYNRHNDLDDDTCSTKAFAIALPSSTPFTRPESSRGSIKSLLYNGSFICEDNFTTKPTQKVSSAIQTYESSKKINHEKTLNLSLILENSKEHGSSSSGNSANMASRHVS